MSVVKRKRSVQLGTRVDPETDTVIMKIADEQDKFKSTVIYDALCRYIESFGKIPVEDIEFEDKPHYAIIAPTDYGKTVLTKEYIVPYFEDRKRVLVIDKQVDDKYPYKEILIEIKDTIMGRYGGDLSQFVEMQSLKPKIQEWCEKIIGQLKATHENIWIRPIFADTDVQAVFISEFFKKLCTEPWNKPILLIVEDAYFYDCRSLVSAARHYNIQAFLNTTQLLDTKVMDNCRLILGPISPTALLEHNVDELGIAAVSTLGSKFEFLWEKQKGIWRKMKFKPSFIR